MPSTNDLLNTYLTNRNINVQNRYSLLMNSLKNWNNMKYTIFNILEELASLYQAMLLFQSDCWMATLFKLLQELRFLKFFQVVVVCKKSFQFVTSILHSNYAWHNNVLQINTTLCHRTSREKSIICFSILTFPN